MQPCDNCPRIKNEFLMQYTEVGRRVAAAFELLQWLDVGLTLTASDISPADFYAMRTAKDEIAKYKATKEREAYEQGSKSQNPPAF